MKIKIPLEVLPNQSLSIRLGNARYKITLKALNESLMAISIERDDVLLIQHRRAVNNQMLLPDYLQQQYGNFIFETINDEYPYYTAFAANHQLYYLSGSE